MLPCRKPCFKNHCPWAHWPCVNLGCDPWCCFWGRAATQLDSSDSVAVSLHWLALDLQGQQTVGTGAWGNLKLWAWVAQLHLMNLWCHLRLLTWLCALLVDKDSGLLNQLVGLSQQFAASGEGLISSEPGKCRVIRDCELNVVHIWDKEVPSWPLEMISVCLEAWETDCPHMSLHNYKCYLLNNYIASWRENSVAECDSVPFVSDCSKKYNSLLIEVLIPWY